MHSFACIVEVHIHTFKKGEKKIHPIKKSEKKTRKKDNICPRRSLSNNKKNVTPIFTPLPFKKNAFESCDWI